MSDFVYLILKYHPIRIVQVFPLDFYYQNQGFLGISNKNLSQEEIFIDFYCDFCLFLTRNFVVVFIKYYLYLNICIML